MTCLCLLDIVILYSDFLQKNLCTGACDAGIEASVIDIGDGTYNISCTLTQVRFLVSC